MKTIIVTTSDDLSNNSYKKGEKGYIDGYIDKNDGITYAICVIKTKLVMVNINHIKTQGLLNFAE